MQEAAAAAGISKDRWASYEYGRAPVRYDLGRKACQMFGFSQRWFATGQLPMWHYVPIPNWVEEPIPERVLFSEAFDNYLAPEINFHYQQVSKTLSLPVARLDEEEEVIESFNRVKGGDLRGVLKDRYDEAFGYQRLLIPDHLLQDYYASIFSAGSDFVQAHWEEVKKHKAARKADGGNEHQETIVDNTPAAGYTSSTDMKTRWNDYQRKLKQLCAVPGTKAAIAKKLKVSRTMVSKWVATEKPSEPSADYAFQLIEWIDEHWKAKPET